MKTKHISISLKFIRRISNFISFRNIIFAFSLLFFYALSTWTAVSQTGTQQIIRLQVSSGIITDETVILFMSNATVGFDIYDSPKMSNNNDSIPEIYTIIGNEPIVINSMPPLTANREITLAFKTGLEGTFKMINNEFTNFPVGSTLKLINNSNGQEQIISNGSEYIFTSEAITRNDMFTVKIELPVITVADPNPDPEPVPDITFSINASNRIVITCSDEIVRGASATVYNSMTGRLAYSVKLNKSVTVINKKLSTGIYTVVVKNGVKTITGQVIVGN